MDNAEVGRPRRRFGLLLRPFRAIAWILVRPFHAQQGKVLRRHENRLERLTGRLDELDAKVAQVRTHGLAVANADDGVLLLKRGDLISDAVLAGSRWDSYVMDTAIETARQKNTLALDIGAHFGVITIGLARLYSRVVSFEPNRFNYNLLRTNVILNGLTNVAMYETPLFSRQAELSLSKLERQQVAFDLRADGRFDAESSTNLGAYSFDEHGTGIFKQKARTLDSYRLDDVAFIKIDVQGADGEVLMGAIDTIKKSRPVVVFEWEVALANNFSVGLDAVMGLFEDLGYDVDVLHSLGDRQFDYVARPRAG